MYQNLNLDKMHELKNYLLFDYSKSTIKIDTIKNNVEGSETIIISLQLYDYDGEKSSTDMQFLIEDLDNAISNLTDKMDFKYNSNSYVYQLPNEIKSSLLEDVKNILKIELDNEDDRNERIQHIEGSQLFEVKQSMSDYIDVNEYIRLSNLK